MTNEEHQIMFTNFQAITVSDGATYYIKQQVRYADNPKDPDEFGEYQAIIFDKNNTIVGNANILGISPDVTGVVAAINGYDNGYIVDIELSNDTEQRLFIPMTDVNLVVSTAK